MLAECGGAASTSVCLLRPPTRCAVWEADAQHLVYFSPWVCEAFSSPFPPRTEWLTHTCPQSDSCRQHGNTTRSVSSSKWGNTVSNQVQNLHFLSGPAICHVLASGIVLYCCQLLVCWVLIFVAPNLIVKVSITYKACVYQTSTGWDKRLVLLMIGSDW